MMDEENINLEEEIRKAAEEAYDKEMDDINSQLEKEIIFALVGEVNSGKSSTINQLLGEDVANVRAKPGETTEVKKYFYKEKITFVDTPGLNDIHVENSDETLRFYKQADVILFFLNAAGTGFSATEHKNYTRLSNINKNIIIVLNKIDAVEGEEVNLLVDYISEQTSCKDIVPISSKTGQNIDVLRNKVLYILKKNSKDILFAKSIKEKGPVAHTWIIGAATAAGAVGASPIPGSDIIPITSIQIGLLTKLATLYGKPLTKEAAKELVLATIVGNIGKSVFRQIVKFIPGVGSVAGATVAGSMTFALGYAVKYAYENNVDLNANNIKNIYNLFYKKGPVVS